MPNSILLLITAASAFLSGLTVGLDGGTGGYAWLSVGCAALITILVGRVLRRRRTGGPS